MKFILKTYELFVVFFFLILLVCSGEFWCVSCFSASENICAHCENCIEFSTKLKNSSNVFLSIHRSKFLNSITLASKSNGFTYTSLFFLFFFSAALLQINLKLLMAINAIEIHLPSSTFILRNTFKKALHLNLSCRQVCNSQ